MNLYLLLVLVHFLTEKRIEEVISFVNEYLEDKYKKKPNLLYGGSVDSSNINDIINIEGINGVFSRRYFF